MPRRTIGRLLFVLALLSVLAPLRSAPALAQTNQRCFPETGQCLSGRFREYWEQNGGLAVFGYPISAARMEHSRAFDGSHLAQWFERNRFEHHPENARPYDVLLGHLGDERLRQQGRGWESFARDNPAAPHYFAETGQAIAPQFWDYWRSHGLEFDGRAGSSFGESLALFGYPISAPAMETNASGDTVLTQWFERARFEYHPHNPAPHKVLLGLLGNEVWSEVTVGSVQTLLDYYRAINERALALAYHFWDRRGAASGQSFEQFEAGYRRTLRVRLLIGAVQRLDPAERRVRVEVTLLAVESDPGGPSAGERVRQYRGFYLLQPGSSSTGWVLAGASLAEVDASNLPLAEVSTPEQTLQTYYAAINGQAFARAYSLWTAQGQASGQPFAAFKHGFETTSQVATQLGTPQHDAGAGQRHARVPVVIVATQRDGSQQSYCGVYGLRMGGLQPFDRLGWAIDQAQIVRTASVQLGSAEAHRLLEGGCLAR